MTSSSARVSEVEGEGEIEDVEHGDSDDLDGTEHYIGPSSDDTYLETQEAINLISFDDLNADAGNADPNPEGTHTTVPPNTTGETEVPEPRTTVTKDSETSQPPINSNRCSSHC